MSGDLPASRTGHTNALQAPSRPAAQPPDGYLVAAARPLLRHVPIILPFTEDWLDGLTKLSTHRVRDCIDASASVR
jgi:hypothetical protein